MKTITIVTGNPGKVAEFQALALDQLQFRMHALDLSEIQSLDLREIVTDKVTRAYEAVQQPVIVDDVSAELDSLKGLPGPFIKFFEQKLGKGALYKLTKVKNDQVVVRCVTAYFDGKHMLFGEGILHGTVVEPRGERGFGFDFVIVPDGETRTFAEMSLAEKNVISHRALAVQELLKQIETLKSS
jgi:non-canonical purine NTP pyrophosphatase (RdgB/HAM1 family)